MIVDKGKYYLYRHIRLDKNEPFYVGIGTKKKAYHTEYAEYVRAFNKQERNRFWKRIANKTEYKVEILLESNDILFILNKEVEFIKLYGRRDLGLGPLVNLTDGGERNMNKIISQSTKDKIRDAAIGRKQSEAQVQKTKERMLLNNPFKGKSHTEKTKRILSEKGSKKIASAKELKKRFDWWVPDEKKDLIMKYLRDGKTYTYIVTELNTSWTVVKKVKNLFKIQDRYDFFTIIREDGMKFLTEAEACKFMGISRGTILKSIKRKCKIKGFYWNKIINNED